MFAHRIRKAQLLVPGINKRDYLIIMAGYLGIYRMPLP